MTISPPQAHSKPDPWLSGYRHDRLMRDAKAYSDSISSMAKPAKPAFNLRRWVWLGIFIGIPTFWAAVAWASRRFFT
jgi:hypothetical protein